MCSVADWVAVAAPMRVLHFVAHVPFQAWAMGVYVCTPSADDKPAHYRNSATVRKRPAYRSVAAVGAVKNTRAW